MDNIRKGYDIVVVSRLRNEKEIKFADLEKDFLLVMKRAGLLEGSLDGNISTGNNPSS